MSSNIIYIDIYLLKVFPTENSVLYTATLHFVPFRLDLIFYLSLSILTVHFVFLYAPASCRHLLFLICILYPDAIIDCYLFTHVLTFGALMWLLYSYERLSL